MKIKGKQNNLIFSDQYKAAVLLFVSSIHMLALAQLRASAELSEQNILIWGLQNKRLAEKALPQQ